MIYAVRFRSPAQPSRRRLVLSIVQRAHTAFIKPSFWSTSQWLCTHYSEAIWASCGLKSPVTQLFLQQLIYAIRTENIKVPQCYSFLRVKPTISTHNKGLVMWKTWPFSDIIVWFKFGGSVAGSPFNFKKILSFNSLRPSDAYIRQ